MTLTESKNYIISINNIDLYKQLNFNKKDLNIILRNNLNNLYDYALNAYTNKLFKKIKPHIQKIYYDEIKNNIYGNIINFMAKKYIERNNLLRKID